MVLLRLQSTCLKLMNQGKCGKLREMGVYIFYKKSSASCAVFVLLDGQAPVVGWKIARGSPPHRDPINQVLHVGVELAESPAPGPRPN